MSVQFSSVAQLCPTLWDPMNCSTPGLPVHHQLPEFTQTHDHRVSDAIQLSHPLSSPSPAPNPSQHQSLSQWCWEPAWGIPPMTRSCREAWWARQVRPQGFPLEFPEQVPQKPESACLIVLCFSTLLTLSGKSWLRASVFCIWQECFS